jgi:hypothetical protein
MQMNTGKCSPIVDARASYCDFWDTLGYNF